MDAIERDLERKVVATDGADRGDVSALLTQKVRAGRIQEVTEGPQSRINALLREGLIPSDMLDETIRQLCPNVEALTNLNDAWHQAQLEDLAYCKVIPSAQNPVIKAVDKKKYGAPELKDLKGWFTIDHLLRIKRLHEGDGTVQNPPRSPIARLVPLGAPLKRAFKGVIGAHPRSFPPTGGYSLSVELDADVPNRKRHKQKLLYDSNKTKLDLIEEGRVWELVFVDGRPEITEAEAEEGNEYLNSDQYANRLQAQGFDLTYVDDLLAVHAQTVSREGMQLFSVQNFDMALGNRLLNIRLFRRDSGVPAVSREPNDPYELDLMTCSGSENGQQDEKARAAVRVKNPLRLSTPVS